MPSPAKYGVEKKRQSRCTRRQSAYTVAGLLNDRHRGGWVKGWRGVRGKQDGREDGRPAA
jgi:hypothetical protein